MSAISRRVACVRLALAGVGLATVRAGHMLFWERPGEFAALVRGFLQKEGLASP